MQIDKGNQVCYRQLIKTILPFPTDLANIVANNERKHNRCSRRGNAGGKCAVDVLLWSPPTINSVDWPFDCSKQ